MHVMAGAYYRYLNTKSENDQGVNFPALCKKQFGEKFKKNLPKIINGRKKEEEEEKNVLGTALKICDSEFKLLAKEVSILIYGQISLFLFFLSTVHCSTRRNMSKRMFSMPDRTYGMYVPEERFFKTFLTPEI